MRYSTHKYYQSKCIRSTFDPNTGRNQQNTKRIEASNGGHMEGTAETNPFSNTDMGRSANGSGQAMIWRAHHDMACICYINRDK